MPRKYAVAAVITVIFVALDQWTKYLVRAHIPLGRRQIVLVDGFLSLVHAENRGASFGIGTNLDPTFRYTVFAVFTVVALAVLAHMLWQLRDDDTWQAAAIGLIASGAVGNAIDRVMKQQVTDFVRVYTEHPPLKAWLVEHFGTYEWPTFNVADSAIVVGLALYFVHHLFIEKEPELEPSPPAEPPSLDEEGQPSS